MHIAYSKQGKVRFRAEHRIKPHDPPVVILNRLLFWILILRS